MNNKDNLRVIKIIRYMYEFWLVLPDNCAQIVAIFFSNACFDRFKYKIKKTKRGKI